MSRFGSALEEACVLEGQPRNDRRWSGSNKRAETGLQWASDVRRDLCVRCLKDEPCKSSPLPRVGRVSYQTKRSSQTAQRLRSGSLTAPTYTGAAHEFGQVRALAMRAMTMQSEGEAFGPETSATDEQVRANWQAYTGAHTREDRRPLRQYPRERATSPCRERHQSKRRGWWTWSCGSPGLTSGTALGEGTVVGDVQADWGSSKDGKRAAVRAQESHIGRASGSAWKAKKKTPKRHAGEQSVCKYLDQGW